MKTWRAEKIQPTRHRDPRDAGRSAAHLIAFVLLLAAFLLVGA